MVSFWTRPSRVYAIECLPLLLFEETNELKISLDTIVHVVVDKHLVVVNHHIKARLDFLV